MIDKIENVIGHFEDFDSIEQFGYDNKALMAFQMKQAQIEIILLKDFTNTLGTFRWHTAPHMRRNL